MGDERDAEPTVRAGAAHLDEDAEALEDPVHSGEARHQHELHEHELPEHELEDAPDEAPGGEEPDGPR